MFDGVDFFEDLVQPAADLRLLAGHRFDLVLEPPDLFVQRLVGAVDLLEFVDLFGQLLVFLLELGDTLARGFQPLHKPLNSMLETFNLLNHALQILSPECLSP
jgi:hypothetical protein